MKIILVIIAIAYLVSFFPALKTAIAFYIYKDKNSTANKAMENGFIIGLLRIWIIYPFFIVKDCFSKI